MKFRYKSALLKTGEPWVLIEAAPHGAPIPFGKLVADIDVDDVEDTEPTPGRSRGEIARAVSMTPKRRKQIAKKAAARGKRDSDADQAASRGFLPEGPESLS